MFYLINKQSENKIESLLMGAAAAILVGAIIISLL